MRERRLGAGQKAKTAGSGEGQDMREGQQRAGFERKAAASGLLKKGGGGRAPKILDWG
jgi:hypothetical protein